METLPNGVKLKDWDDYDAQREEIYETAKATIASKFPQKAGGVRLELHDLDYQDPPTATLKQQKEALLGNQYLSRRLRGTWKLFDDQTNQLLEERAGTVMRVPMMTQRGTFLHGGSEYSTMKQMRLTPGVYARRKISGELESHFNTRRGTGQAFRVSLEPESGLFKMDIGQSSLRLYSLMKDLGVPDSQLEKSWGSDLLKANQKAYDSRVFAKAHAKLVRRPMKEATQQQKVQEIRDALTASRLDRSVVARNLPNRLNPPEASEPRELDAGDYHKLASVLTSKLRPGMTSDADQLTQDLSVELQQLKVAHNPKVLRALVQQVLASALVSS